MLSRVLNKVVRVSKQKLRRSTAKSNSDLARLRSSDDAKTKAIGEAIFETVSRIQPSDEVAATEKVEQRRNELLTTKREIPKVDFGAGSWRNPRSEEEVRQGVQSTASVASIARASKPKFWATLLFKLARKVPPTSGVELGTCVGISAAYQGFAMQLNGKGKLVTLEGSPETAKIAQETLDGLGLSNSQVIVGPFHETLDETLRQSNPIDYFFNDGHHDRDAVLRYFEQAKPYLTEDAMVVFDDISWSPGMREAWETIERDERVALSVDLHDVGVVLLGKRSGDVGKHRVPL